MGARNRRFFEHAAISAAIASAIVLCVVLTLLNQPAKRTWIHTWTPSDGLNVPVNIADSPVEQFTITMRCPAAISESRVLIATTAAPDRYETLSLRQKGNRIVVALGATELAGQKLDSGPCTLTMRYNSDTESVALEVGDKVTNVHVDRGPSLFPAPRMSGIHADSVTKSLDAKVETRIWTSQTSPTGTQVLACIAAFVLLALLALTTPRGSPAAAVAPFPTGRAWPATLMVVVTALVGWFTAPQVIDDGWLVAVAREYSNVGYGSNYFHHSAPVMPQGHWLTSLSRLWLELPNNVLIMRVAPLICILASWLIINRAVIKPLAARSGSTLPIYLAAVAYLPWAAAPMFTLRYEPIVVLLWSIGVAGLVRVVDTGSLRAFMSIFVVAALGIAAHQTGFSVGAVALVAFVVMVKRHRDGHTVEWIRVAAIIVATSAVGLLAFLVDNRLLDLLRSVREYSDARTFQKSLLSIDHWIEGITNGANIRSFAIISLIALLAAGLRSSANETDLTRTLRLTAYLTLASGTVNASKWMWHLTTFAPMAVILAAIAASQLVDLNDDVARRTRAKAILIIAAVIAGIAITRSVRLTTDYKSGWWLLALIPFVAIPFVQNFHKRFAASSVCAGLLGLTLVVFATDIIPNVAAVKQDRWSITEQNLRTIFRSGECGVLDQFHVVLPGDALNFAADEKQNHEFGPPVVNGVNIRPFPNVRVFTTSSKTDPTFKGDVLSPWQNIDGLRTVAFWTLSDTDTFTNMTVEIQRTDGTTGVMNADVKTTVRDEYHYRNEKIDPNSKGANYWLANVINVPDNTVAIRVHLRDTSAVENKFRAATEFVVPKNTSLRDVYRANTKATFVESDLGLFAPCVTEPHLDQGLYENVGLSIGQPYWSFGLMPFEHAMVEIGCMSFENLHEACSYLVT